MMANHADAHGAAANAPRDLRAAIHRGLAHAAHLLPDQAPIRVFIHHNTLHAFQHLPFHQAVLEAQRVYGAEPYLREERYRELMKTGRIELDDLCAALADQLPESAAVFMDGLLDARQIRLTMLRFAIVSETPASLAWLISERGVTRKLRAEVPDDVRAAFVTTSGRWLRGVLGSDTDAVWKLGQLITGERSPEDVRAALRRDFGCELDRGALTEALERDAEPFATSALWHACVGLTRGVRTPVGGAHGAHAHMPLHRDVLLARTGEDVYDRVLPVLLRAAAAYVDDGLAAWSMPAREAGFYPAVRKLVAYGSAPHGRWSQRARDDFRAQLARGNGAIEVVEEVLEELGVGVDEAEHYLETLLLTLPGWAGMFSRLERHREDRPADAPPASLLDFLAVRLTFERAALRDLAERLGSSLAALWRTRPVVESAHDAPAEDAAYRLFQLFSLLGIPVPSVRALSTQQAWAIVAELDAFDHLVRRRIFQEAFERHYRVQILDALSAHRDGQALTRQPTRPSMQFICCFDDREESLRRHLEEVEPDCQTFGAPGFFGAAVRFRALDEHSHVPLAPVVISPTHHIDERARHSDAPLLIARARRRRNLARVMRGMHAGSRSLWRGMVLNAALGLLATVPLLVRIVSPRSAGRVRAWASSVMLPTPRTELTVHHDEAGDAGIPRGFKVDERVGRVATVLENIGFTDGFAKIVVLLGHGATTLNNPHKSAYDCGACGGRQGGPNARIFAHMANDPDVRAGLAERDIQIPSDTVFVGGQHDTCSDGVTLFELDGVPPSHAGALEATLATLAAARARTAQERCRRLFSAPRDPSPEQALAHVEGRSEHLAEPRPEFGHATNAVAIIGRRGLSRGLFLDRRAFVLSYDPTLDADGAILERTLAAALPVGAGINLEYYFSHVDNPRYGAGSKLPHNVVGLLGVMSGHASDLRTGLPRQMIEIHEPVRLLIVVEATPERLLQITARQAEVREFVVNRWVQLVSCDPDTGALSVFTERGFEPYSPRTVTLPEAASSRDFYRGSVGFLPPARIVGTRVRAT